jgi:hypothetical protein
MRLARPRRHPTASAMSRPGSCTLGTSVRSTGASLPPANIPKTRNGRAMVSAAVRSEWIRSGRGARFECFIYSRRRRLYLLTLRPAEVTRDECVVPATSKLLQFRLRRGCYGQRRARPHKGAGRTHARGFNRRTAPNPEPVFRGTALRRSTARNRSPRRRKPTRLGCCSGPVSRLRCTSQSAGRARSRRRRPWPSPRGSLPVLGRCCRSAG